MAFDFLTTERFTEIELVRLPRPADVDPVGASDQDRRPATRHRGSGPRPALADQPAVAARGARGGGRRHTVDGAGSDHDDAGRPVGSDGGRRQPAPRPLTTCSNRWWSAKQPAIRQGRACGRGPRPVRHSWLRWRTADWPGRRPTRPRWSRTAPLSLNPDHHPGDGEFASLDPDWQRLTRLLANRPLADGELVCRAFEDAGGGLPDWLVPVTAADESALLDLAGVWAEWYRAEVSPRTVTPETWVGERLEYQFRIAASDVTLDAPSHLGGEIGWYTFDALPDVDLPDPPPGSPDADAAERQVHAVLASPLRYPGMPADRLWELEDAQVNLGLIEAEPWDLARLLVAEFALTYGNDWLVVPVDVPYGTLTRVESVYYVTTFGERFRVRPTEQTGVVPDGDWRMFAITTADGETVDGLLIPPGAIAVQDGPPIEEVLFLRDEMANLAWAVERSVQGPSGSARDRSRERDGINPPPLLTVRARGAGLHPPDPGPGAMDSVPAANRRVPVDRTGAGTDARCRRQRGRTDRGAVDRRRRPDDQGRRDPARGDRRPAAALDDATGRRHLRPMADATDQRRSR